MTARLPKIRLFSPVVLMILAGMALAAWANLAAPRSLPADPAARLQALRAAGLPAEAEPVFELLLRQRPLDPDLHVAYIQNHFEIPEVKASPEAGAALLGYYQARLGDPDASPAAIDLAHLSIGRVRAAAGDPRRALRQYALVRDGGLKYLNLSIAEARRALGQSGRAAAAYRAEIAAGGDVAQAAGELAGLYQEQGQAAELQALLADPQTARHAPYEPRRWAARQAGDLGAYLALSFGEPWRWVGFEGGLLALFAGGVWLLYFLRVDLFGRIPAWALFLTPALAALLTPAVFPLRDLLFEILPLAQGQSWQEDLAFAVLYAGLVEELVKLLPAVLVGALLKRSERFDWLVLGALSALGFATFENGLYFTSLGPSVAATRFLYSLPLHLAMSGIAAGAWAGGRSRRGWFRLLPLGGLAAAVTLHGLFNFFLAHQGVLGGAVMIVTIYLFGKGMRKGLSILLAWHDPLEGSLRIRAGGLLLIATLALINVTYLFNYLAFSTGVANQQLGPAMLMGVPALMALGTSLGYFSISLRTLQVRSV